MKYLLCNVLFPIPKFMNIKVGKELWTKYIYTEEIVCNISMECLLIYYWEYW